MKKVFTLVFTLATVFFLVACSKGKNSKQVSSEQEVTTASETTTITETKETYKKSQEINGGKQDIYIDLTYTGDTYQSLVLRYETIYEGEALANFQAQGREAVEASFNEHLEALIPGISAIKDLKGVDVKSTVDENFAWKLTVSLDPNVVNFEDLATKGDTFAYLAKIEKMPPSQLIAGFSIIGFEKVPQ
ncbi:MULTISPECIES: hypothetical protein [Streptococcus]|uniref:Lipoprotein n=1 Tax=Streptococcus caledonicus TaxID=2614158 RepID=A0ABW0UCW6_9STRE|nr:hypothetical protein [Streptococcus sp. S784/96/1]